MPTSLRMKGKREREETDEPGSELSRLREQVTRLQRETAKQARIIDSQNAEVSSLKAEVSNLKEKLSVVSIMTRLLEKSDNNPIKALWEALHDTTIPGRHEVPMAIIMDLRCGIERRCEVTDRLEDADGYYIGDETPLLLSIRAGRNDVVEAILRADTDHTVLGNYGQSALMTAALLGNTTTMDLLIRFGADLAATSTDGISVAHYAADKKQYRVVKAIADHGANLDVVGAGGQTPLFIATRLGDSLTLETLLSLGASLDTIDDSGSSPLHSAARMGKVWIVKALLREGASITAINKSGYTPLDMYFQFADGIPWISAADKATMRYLLTSKYCSGTKWQAFVHLSKIIELFTQPYRIWADPNVKDSDGDNSLMTADSRIKVSVDMDFII